MLLQIPKKKFFLAVGDAQNGGWKKKCCLMHIHLLEPSFSSTKVRVQLIGTLRLALFFTKIDFCHLKISIFFFGFGECQFHTQFGLKIRTSRQSHARLQVPL